MGGSMLKQANLKIYAAFGMHPHNAKEYTDEIEAKLVVYFSASLLPLCFDHRHPLS
jgi:Tat protein secretion system quality control protein TatD with DNase activity